MRTFRPALLALALASTVAAAPADAALGDGPENAGAGCQARLTRVSDTTWTGVMTGGAWVAAELVENEGGAIRVAGDPGVPSGFAMKCWIHETYGGADHARVNASVVGPLAVFTAVPVSFDTLYNTFEVCTEVSWDVPGDPTHRQKTCTEIVAS